MGDPLPRSHDLRSRVRKRGFIRYPWFFAVPELSRNFLSYEGDIVVSAAGMAASAGMRPEGGWLWRWARPRALSRLITGEQTMFVSTLVRSAALAALLVPDSAP